jgi:RNA polymerase sigma-70 factor (ECF subfamily)
LATLGSSLDRWLFSMLRSIWLNEVQASEPHLSVVDFGNAVADPILREVLMLKEHEREALFLVYVEGLTCRQAAEMLEMPIGTIMARLATARERLAVLAADSAARTGMEHKSR